MPEKLKKGLAWVFEHDDFIFSAFWVAMAVNCVMGGAAVLAPFFLVFVVHHWRHIQHKKTVRIIEKFIELDCLCMEELAQELGKAVGPKIPNDILRKHIERIHAEINKDKKPPKAGAGSGAKKFFLGLFRPQENAA